LLLLVLELLSLLSLLMVEPAEQTLAAALATGFGRPAPWLCVSFCRSNQACCWCRR
jgi:hypothetical protein